MKKNWTILNSIEDEKTWKFVYEKLKFAPRSSCLIDFSNIKSKCFDISEFYDDGYNEDYYIELHENSIKAFIAISNGHKVYALNWQHDSYSFDPKKPFELDEFGEWYIPVYPNGDYCFFLDSETKNGIFADGINLTFTLFGDKFIDAFDIENTSILIKEINR